MNKFDTQKFKHVANKSCNKTNTALVRTRARGRMFAAKMQEAWAILCFLETNIIKLNNSPLGASSKPKIANSCAFLQVRN